MLITVKAVIVNKLGEVLILKRARGEKTHAGNYDLPGGSMERDETIREALRREIKEETGLIIDNENLIKVSEYPEGHKKFNDLKALRFVVSYDGDDYKKIKLEKAEHNKFEWLSIVKAIEKLSDEGFEKEKKETLIEAKKYLEMKNSLENWKRCLAEFDNYKKRQEEARKDIVKYATENIVMQILPVIDNFTSAAVHIPEDEKDGAWVRGIMFIKKQLEDVLRDNGVEEIEVKVGDEFDTKIHEAIKDVESVEQQGGRSSRRSGSDGRGATSSLREEKNKIKKVVLRGYKIGDKVVRPARVVVE